MIADGFYIVKEGQFENVIKKKLKLEKFLKKYTEKALISDQELF